MRTPDCTHFLITIEFNDGATKENLGIMRETYDYIRRVAGELGEVMMLVEDNMYRVRPLYLNFKQIRSIDFVPAELRYLHRAGKEVVCPLED